MDFQKNLNQHLNEVYETDIPSLHKQFVDMAKQWGGKVYLVGGAVRDEIMGTESKDLDYVVTKIPLADLEGKLKAILPGAKVTSEIGKGFGIIKMSLGNDDFDFAIPRADIDRDNVKTDPNIPIESDLLRRDMTANSLAKDLETGEIISPTGFDGVSDIKNKILRAVGNASDRFNEDPLRMLRAISMAARFGFTIEPKTLQSIKENIDLLKKVSSERYYDEFFKGWTKGTANTEYFNNILIDTGIGRLLFGPEFNPISIKYNGPADKKFLAQYIAEFLNGGDYMAMNKKLDEQEYVKVARWFKTSIEKGIDFNTIKVISKDGDLFPFALEVFKLIDSGLYKATKKMISKPLISQLQAGERKSWELPIMGGELIELSKELGKPLTGRAINEAMINLIKAYQTGIIKAYDDPEKNKAIIKKYMSLTLLNENFVKDSVNLEILRNRITNILYK